MYHTRSRTKRDPREKLFIAFEGTKTEPLYFEGLIEKEEKNLNVEIIPLYRGPGREGDSNPKKIVDQVYDYFQWVHGRDYSTNLFIEHVLQSAIKIAPDKKSELNGELFREMKHALTRSKYADDRHIMDRDEALLECRRLIAERIGKINVDLPYPLSVSDSARFFIVVDRDCRSFTEEQCEYVCKKCKENNFELIVSNPCFELWLLLHFNVGKEQLANYLFRNNGLKGLIEDITKRDSLDFNCYHHRIGRARRCLRDEYCEDLQYLLMPTDYLNGTMFNIGTNMGALIDIIFSKGYPERDEVLR